MSGFVAALVLSYFLMTSLMTFRLFKRPVTEPFGATFITVAAVLGTLANITLWWRLPPADGGLALAMIALAIPLYVLAVRASHGQGFWRAFSTRTPADVVDAGIYRYLRHPFYVSYMIYWLSWCVLNSYHLVSLLIAAVMISVYVAAALKEERLLTLQFGQRYIQYSHQTWMFVPCIV